MTSSIAIVSVYLFWATVLGAYIVWRQRQLKARYPTSARVRAKARFSFLSLFLAPAAADVWFVLGFPIFAIVAVEGFLPSPFQLTSIPWSLVIMACAFWCFPIVNRATLERRLLRRQRQAELESLHQHLKRIGKINGADPSPSP